MNRQKIKILIKKIIPPFILDIFRGFNILGQNSFTGNYASWNEAISKSRGYEDEAILEKVQESSLKVKNGIASYERDSVAFYEPDYRWPVLSALLYVANQQKKLHVLDFGGSLGSLFFQHKKWFAGIEDFFWGVVEQPHFVDVGNREFTTKELGFFFNINEYIEQQETPDIVILSGVLQYLEFPFQILQTTLSQNPPFLLIDRVALTDEDRDRLTVQAVPVKIYNASYPAWFFSEQLFIERVKSFGYFLVSEFACDEHFNRWSYLKGYLFKKDND